MADPTEVRVPDIQPFGFIIEILDDEQEPISGRRFNVAVDGGNASTMETDEDGILRTAKPRNQITLSLPTSQFF